MTEFNLRPLQLINNKLYNECNELYNKLSKKSSSHILFLTFNKNNKYMHIKYFLLNFHKKIINDLLNNFNIINIEKKQINKLKIYIFDNEDFNKLILNNKITNKIYFFDDNDFNSFYQNEYIYENITFENIKNILV